MEKITLVINEKEVSVSANSSILEAARSTDVYIPSLCDYPGLKPMPEITPDRACQLCIVDIDGRVTLSCNTQVREGMKVKTETSDIKELRQKKLSDILRQMRRIPGDFDQALGIPTRHQTFLSLPGWST